MQGHAYRWRKGEESWKTRVLTAPGGRKIAAVKLKSAWSTEVEVTLGGGRSLTMSRPSVWKSDVSIRDGDGNEIGRYSSKWWTAEGALRLNGTPYFWKSTSWWSGKRAWVDERGREVMQFALRWSWSGIDADAEVFHPSPDDETLLAIGWYLLYLGMTDASAAS